MIKKDLIGLMSGTSLDGLDIVHVNFFESEGKIDFTILNSKTIAYPKRLENKIRNIEELDVQQVQILDKTIGLFYAEQVNSFLNEFNIDLDHIDAIASHGQTIYHQPDNGFTLQIGCGGTLAYHTGIPVINDFRTLDVIAGGQGAPLVPIGDFVLFNGKAESYLNIGGFCNISFKENNTIRAFDICPGNLPLNKYANNLNVPYDKGGAFAKNGVFNKNLSIRLNELKYYQKSAPKSLGTEWLSNHFYPLIEDELDTKSILRTVTSHIAEQIADTLLKHKLESVYVTGGGAKNDYLIDLIRTFYRGEIIIPDPTTIDFKEALVFAYLGFKYLLNESNNLPSVTGSERELCTGVLHIPGY